MSTHVEVVKTPDVLGGDPRIAGTRIGVHHIVTAMWYQGTSAETLVSDIYPQISEEDVFAALDYYHDNHDEIEAIRRESATPTGDEITRPEDLPADHA